MQVPNDVYFTYILAAVHVSNVRSHTIVLNLVLSKVLNLVVNLLQQLSSLQLLHYSCVRLYVLEYCRLRYGRTRSCASGRASEIPRFDSLHSWPTTGQYMGSDDYQYVLYSITVLYTHILLMNPQCYLLWPHKCTQLQYRIERQR